MDELGEIKKKAEKVVDTPTEWVRIELKWKDDFQDLGGFRSALNEACDGGGSFDQIISMVREHLEAYDLIARASLEDLGTLKKSSVSRVGAWDRGRHSERRQGCLAEHFRFKLSQAKRAKIFLTSDVDNYLQDEIVT